MQREVKYINLRGKILSEVYDVKEEKEALNTIRTNGFTILSIKNKN